MLTVKDINNKQFEQTRPGYSPEEVDNFLKEVASDIAKYQKEREETEKKIEVLVQTVREYKNDEDALKDALIGAQKQSRAIINDAQINANKIISEANEKAHSIVGDTQNQITREKECLIKMQKEVSDFKSNLLSMYKQHLEIITSIPDDDDEIESEEIQQDKAEETPKAENISFQPASVSSEQTNNMSNMHDKKSYPFDDESEKTGNNYNNLKFGQNK